MARFSTTWWSCSGKFSPPLTRTSIQRRCGRPIRTCFCARSWASGTHARLAFQSQFEDSGKTTAMTMLQYIAARAMATSSLTGASLFRETDAHHWTVLWDEADNAFHKNTNPELVGVFNAGHDRQVRHRPSSGAEPGRRV